MKKLLVVILALWCSVAQAQIVNPGIDTGSWTSYTPTVTAGSGAFTTAAATGRYKQIGKTVFVEVAVSITTNGTAATYVGASLPAPSSTSNNYMIPGRGVNVSGKTLNGAVLTGNNTNMQITNYDNTYPGANGEALIMSGIYEAQ